MYPKIMTCGPYMNLGSSNSLYKNYNIYEATTNLNTDWILDDTEELIFSDAIMILCYF